jgi:hypothetical protein
MRSRRRALRRQIPRQWILRRRRCPPRLRPIKLIHLHFRRRRCYREISAFLRVIVVRRLHKFLELLLVNMMAWILEFWERTLTPQQQRSRWRPQSHHRRRDIVVQNLTTGLPSGKMAAET